MQVYRTYSSSFTVENLIWERLHLSGVCVSLYGHSSEIWVFPFKLLEGAHALGAVTDCSQLFCFLRLPQYCLSLCDTHYD